MFREVFNNMLTSIQFDNKPRDIILMGDIDEDKVKGVIDKITDINSFDDVKEKEIANYVREPINLYISSFGGCVYTGMSLMGLIQLSKTKIITIGLGKIMSMGLYIFLCGHERQVHKFSTFLYHEVSSIVWGKLEGIKQDLEEGQRLQDILDTFLLERTVITKDKIDEIKKAKKDWFIPATEAIKFGIAEKVL